MRIGSSRALTLSLPHRGAADGVRRVEAGASGAGVGPEDRRGEAGAEAARVAEAIAEAPVRIVRYRPHAPFLAQMIAHREDLPQTRRLRRAEPAAASRLYARVAEGRGLLVPGYFVDVDR